MKTLLIFAFLVLPLSARAWDCGDDVKNNFRLGSTRPNEMSIYLSGSGADTTATEILASIKTAGAKAGVITGAEAVNIIDPNTGEVQHLDTYVTGNMKVSVAPFEHYCPKTLVEIKFKTDTSSQWTVSTKQEKGKSYLVVTPSNGDVPTLVSLLNGSGIQPIQRQLGSYIQNYYQGKNIQCTTLSAAGKKPSGSCSILVDLSN